MIPVRRIQFETLCAVYGEALARMIWHPAPPGWL
ncbi:hypothetical protein EDD52_12736 [Primorskyibacter sedentarius]|uniref:Uncharacterized protein n=1 Tax=Primorskyibacter sedentarius TaxID=745311 RepID=A0A4R3J163_9RHOB|nr:hypothetical protein EDD52_12736 [Primorskyibacter sedentarius]